MTRFEPVYRATVYEDEAVRVYENLTVMPRALRTRPIAAAATPLPTELTTPPVKKIYFVIAVRFSSSLSPDQRGKDFHLP